MFISENKNKYISIEQELLSNSNNLDELMEGKELFSALQEIRNRQNIHWRPSEILNITSFKSLLVHLLYTSGLLPFAVTDPPSLRSVHNMPGSVSVFPVQDTYGRPAQKRPSRFCENPLSCQPPAPDLPPRPPNHPASVPRAGLKRTRRKANVPESLYLPPPHLVNENIRNFLDRHDASIAAKTLSTIGLINAVVDVLMHQPNDQSRIVRAILTSSGFFGAQETEVLSVSGQKKTILSWMESLLYSEGVETHIVGEFLSLTERREPKTLITTTALYQRLMGKKDATLSNSSAPVERLTAIAANYINNNLILPLLPVFTLEPLPEAPPVGSLEWGYLHIGMGFAVSAGLDRQSLTTENVSALGMLLESMLKEDLLDPALAKLLMLPALFFYINSRHDQGNSVIMADILASGRIKQHILAEFLAASDRLAGLKDPAAYYYELLEHYQHRAKLAEEIITAKCALRAPLEPDAIRYYQFNHDNTKCSDLNAKSKDKKDRLLPDLNAMFNRQNREIADAFAVLDKKNILEVLSRYDQDEYHFLCSADVKIIRADFTHRIQSFTAWGYLSFSQYSNLYIAQVVDLILAKQDKRERIYALIFQNNTYRLKRLDEHASSYFELMQNYRPELENDPNIRVRLYKEQQSWLKQANQELDVLAGAVSQTHRHKLYGNLNVIGYDATSAEQFRSLLYSLIPLYDCITHMKNGETQQGVAACGTDIAALIPLAGTGVRLGSRIAVKLGFGAGLAIAPMFSGVMLRQSLRAGMRAGLSRLARYGVKPVSRELNRKFLAHVAVESLRLFDPGIELTGRVSHMALQRVKAALEIARKDLPVLNDLVSLIAKRSADQTMSAPEIVFSMARHPALHVEVPVIKLGGDRFHGKNVYLRVNPEGPDPFGIKYTLDHSNTLVRIPVPFAKRMQNILTQGLGGLGAKTRGESWMSGVGARERVSQDSYMDVVLYQKKPGNQSPYGADNRSGSSMATDWRRMYEVEKYKPVKLRITTYGTLDSEQVLFPELGIRLHQSDIDATEYERAFAGLTEHEKTAVRTWTLIENDGKSYSDGTPNLTKQFKEPINVEINQKLRDGQALSWEEENVYNGLLTFLRKDIPRQEGSYLRVAEYGENQLIPWENDIAVGDIVTNYPQLMSVSADDTFARLYAEQAAEDGPVVANAMKAMILYRFDNARQCTPLLPMAASTVTHEVEYLYSPMTFFRVKSISVATSETAFFHPKKRIGVILEELDSVPPTAANLFSGDVYNIQRPVAAPAFALSSAAEGASGSLAQAGQG